MEAELLKSKSLHIIIRACSLLHEVKLLKKVISFSGEIVMLRDIKSMNQNIFLTVDTTCPLPRSIRPPTPKTSTPRPFEPPPTIPEDNDGDDNVILPKKKSKKRRHRQNRRKREKYDESDIPDWIKAEMELAAASTYDETNEVQKRQKHQRKRSDEEHIKKMQKEFEQKRKELLLEAENVVRMREEAYNQELLKLQTELEKHKRMQRNSLQAASGTAAILENEEDQQMAELDGEAKKATKGNGNCCLQ